MASFLKTSSMFFLIVLMSSSLLAENRMLIGESTEDDLSSSVIDHGVFGTLFDIAEEDMIVFLTKKVSALKESGQLEKIEGEMKQKSLESLRSPTPVQGLKKTKNPRTFTHDPTLTVSHDLKDHQGRIFAKKGTRVNPLHYQRPSKALLLIDGNDVSQVTFARDHQHAFIIVLVSGHPIELEEQLGVSIYFDQGGVLCRHYGIEQIPAKIEATGNHLTVTEFKVPE